MLQIQNLTIRHLGDDKNLLENFNCVVNKGDKAVIIGEEGNGKSTLLKWIYDPALIEPYAHATGRLVSRNETTGQAEKLGYLPQELPEVDAELSVYDYFQAEPVFWESSPGELGRLARGFGLSAECFYSDQKMATLSGGEKIKIQLLRLMIMNPTVLLLDEPSNDLDLETLTWLEDMISGWSGAIIYISHDETLIEKTANMVIHLEQLYRKRESRWSVKRVPYRTYVAERQQSFAKQEMQAASDLRAKKIRDEKWRRIYQSVDHAQEVITRQDPPGARLLKKKMKAVLSMEKRFEREDENMTQRPFAEEAINFVFGENAESVPAGKTVLDISLPELKAPDGRVLAKDIHLVVKGAEKICIVGQNGCGKTTLLKQIAEALQTGSGIGRSDLKTIYMPQRYQDELDYRQTPVQYLAETFTREEESRNRTYLGALRFTIDEMDHEIGALSGGQKAKLFLLKMTLSKANVLVLDEPTRNFSPLSGPVIREMLKAFPGAIISVSHDRKFISEVAETVYELKEDGLQKADYR
ncbi:MAG: ABC-F family ATP-binding cassette domain-containing protein [Firmicutes bacterium]|nr:ABC-F family ATP-binding cassette domain-containing protein [Bacillota bacterium]